ncbi:MAG: hypothetical protein H9W81_17240 [Enterococcus sp.]|nr:hypothetical protein [Enterococcus sp.]
MGNKTSLATMANHIYHTEKSTEIQMEASAGQINQDYSLTVLTTVPLIISGILGPTLIAPELYLGQTFTPPSMVAFALAVGCLLNFDSSRNHSRMIRHQFKNTTGEGITLKSARSIRVIQKSLTARDTEKILPAKDFLPEDSHMLKVAEDKGFVLNVVIRPDSVHVQVLRPDAPEVVWDKAFESLNSVYQLT